MSTKQPLLPSKAAAFARCISRPDDELKRFRSCLRWMCVDQSSPWRALVSWSLFLLLAVVAPAISNYLEFSDRHRPYNDVVQVSLTAAASLAFICLSAALRRYGLRRLLFLDKLCGASAHVQVGYTAELHDSFRILSLFVLPCFVAECVYKVYWYSTGARRIPFLGNPVASDVLACALELASWIYRTGIFLLVCVLFRLICHLQIMRLKDFNKVFEEESDVEAVLQEHLKIRRHLMVISHRFRLFIVGALVVVTASQFAALLLTTRPSAVVDLFSAGELAICSVGLVTGLLICLRSAARITHKAQGITSHAAKWHVTATIDCFTADPETPSEAVASGRNFVAADGEINGGESDEYEESIEDELEGLRIVQPHANTISFQKRQALVTYLEKNMAGITLFGFVLDRGYLHTIFMLQLSLVLWLLGKTIGIS